MELIEGVRIKELTVIPDQRGRLMEMLRSDDELFMGFGQAYLTTTYPGVVKAWHLHRQQADNIVCVAGMIRLGIFDERRESKSFGRTGELYLGVHRPRLVQIPAGLWHGWKCVSPEEALIINFPTRPYDYDEPDEERLDPRENHIPWDWDSRDG